MKDFVYRATNGKDYEFSGEEFKGFIDSLFKERYEDRRNVISFLTEELLAYHESQSRHLYGYARILCDENFRPYSIINELVLVKEKNSRDNMYHLAMIYARLGDGGFERDPVVKFVHDGHECKKSDLDENAYFLKDHWGYNNLGHLVNYYMLKSQRSYIRYEKVDKDKQEMYEKYSKVLAKFMRLRWKEEACRRYGSLKQANNAGYTFDWSWENSRCYIEDLKKLDQELVELQQKHLNKKNALENDGKTYLKLDIPEQEMER